MRMLQPYGIVWLFTLLWLLTLASLLARPAASLETASGLYAPQQRDGLTYQWTGSRVQIPIDAASGPTSFQISLGPARWAERSAPQIVLSGPAGRLAHFPAPDELRHYRLLLAPDTSFIQLDTLAEKPPGREPRWLGVTVYGLEATANGLPLQRLAQALALLPAFALVGLCAAWAVRGGFAVPLALFGLALALRVVLLERTPPGWRVDELVSLIDAWHLAQTGRDHLGNLLPLGAFEALGDWISPLLTYLELPFVAIFGPQRLVGRLVVALAGALAAPLCYVLARRLGLGGAGAVAAGLATALSPWQIFMGRIALPPALVPTFWLVCLLAGVHFIQRRDRRSALWLALAAGVALYAYPTLKLAMPLLVAGAVGLALLRARGQGFDVSSAERDKGTKGQGTGDATGSPAHRLTDSLAHWLPAAFLLALLWSPFAYVTLFNPASATRLGQAALRAENWWGWLGAWWQGYSVYFLPDFYYRNGDGSSIRGVPGYGLELWATLPLVLLGLATLIYSILRKELRTENKEHASSLKRVLSFQFSVLSSPHLFILFALLLAPLAASLTLPSPHTYRAAPLAPLYALLVGYGVSAVIKAIGKQGDRGTGEQPVPTAMPANESPSVPLSGRYAPGLVLLALLLALGWQGALWWHAYTEEYPAVQAALNQDGADEAVRRAVARAAGYDEIWVSYDSIDQPYLFVLAAQPFPAAEAQRLLVVERRANRFNAVTSLGPYRFVDTSGLPLDLPTLDAVPARSGGPGYVVQEWMEGGKRVLVVRRML
jgi:hypothetical protein